MSIGASAAGILLLMATPSDAPEPPAEVALLAAPQTAASDFNSATTLRSQLRSWNAGDTLIAFAGGSQGVTRAVGGIQMQNSSDAALPSGDQPSWTVVASVNGNNGSQTSWLAVAIATAPTTVASGKVAITASGSLFQWSSGLLVIPAAVAVRQHASGVRDSAGSSISLALAVASLETSLHLVLASRRGGDSAFTPPSGYSEISNTQPGAQHRLTVWQRGAASSGGNGGNAATVGNIAHPAAAIMLELRA